MYKHEKQTVERLQSNHIYMLSTLSTAIIAFLLIISLSGMLLFPVMAFADAPQPVAQVGNTTYMSVQDAIGHTSMKNNTVTLLTDTTESITVTPPKVVRGVTLELNGHALNASNTTAITVPANMQLTIVGPGTVAGGTQPAVDCRGTLRVESGTFTSDATLMRFAETNETSAQGSFSGGTFTAPMLFNLLDDAKNLGYVTIRGGEYRGVIPAGLNTLALLSGSFSDLSNLAPYLADSLGLVPGGTSDDGMGDGMFHVGDLAISGKQTSVELDPASGLQQLSADDLLTLTGTQLNGIADLCVIVGNHVRHRRLGNSSFMSYISNRHHNSHYSGSAGGIARKSSHGCVLLAARPKRDSSCVMSVQFCLEFCPSLESLVVIDELAYLDA